MLGEIDYSDVKFDASNVTNGELWLEWQMEIHLQNRNLHACYVTQNTIM